MWQPCPQTREKQWGTCSFESLHTRKLPIWNPTVMVSYGCRRKEVKNAVAHRATTEQTAIMTVTQRPIAMKCLGEAIKTPAWRTIASWYLLAEDDRMFSPKTQRFVADRMGAQVRAHHVDHAPQISEPATVVEFVLEAASATL